jgi:hypothetical protein
VSAWLDNEPLTVSLLIGAPLILIGVYVGALRGRERKHRPEGDRVLGGD